ncbi:methyltransferase, FkbM family [Chitinophaga costaii]|uniref:Methyltransferase, FkbM family n=1 Tax=Chitinophaga costaii TaxID=1335309 RepID=A0A1C4ECH9_9BACT|nr:FkbM family methyltransferase [Chitinophaga costaii]PUZ23909.1 FkbM family methyltransferase [Chitinophaga costaii]SCC41313.1 methyltransferase, FkbM family [Chitinophaga costaii]
MDNRERQNSFAAKIMGAVVKRGRQVFRRKGPYEFSRAQRIILKHQPAGQLRHIPIAGQQFWYRNPLELLHSQEEILADEIYKFNSNTDRPFIIDCGANMGMGVLYFKNSYPQAEVWAYEPDQTNFELLQKNVATFHDVTLHQQAIWTHNGFITFEASGTLSSKIVEGEEAATASSMVRIPCVRLADILAQRTVQLLKIDIEGAEYAVLKDCAPFLHQVENMFLEYHGYVQHTSELEELLLLVRQKGFVYYIREAAACLPHPFTDKQRKGDYDVQLNIFCYRLP